MLVKVPEKSFICHVLRFLARDGEIFLGNNGKFNKIVLIRLEGEAPWKDRNSNPKFDLISSEIEFESAAVYLTF